MKNRTIIVSLLTFIGLTFSLDAASAVEGQSVWIIDTNGYNANGGIGVQGRISLVPDYAINAFGGTPNNFASNYDAATTQLATQNNQFGYTGSVPVFGLRTMDNVLPVYQVARSSNAGSTYYVRTTDLFIAIDDLRLNSGLGIAPSISLSLSFRGEQPTFSWNVD